MFASLRLRTTLAMHYVHPKRASKKKTPQCSYFRIIGARVGVSLGAAGDIAKVSQTFHPAARCCSANSP
jgi:hypothetical protein